MSFIETVYRSFSQYRLQRAQLLGGKKFQMRYGKEIILNKKQIAKATQKLLQVKAQDTDQFLDLDIELPQIDEDIQQYQKSHGAIFNDQGVVAWYDNEHKDVVQASFQGVTIFDRSHWGRVRISGEDRLSFLHNQSTNSFLGRQKGEGCETVFVTPTARCLDLATCYIQEESVMVILSPLIKKQLLERMDKYIFPMDKVQVQDVSPYTGMLTIVGPQSTEIFKSIGMDMSQFEEYSHTLFRISSDDSQGPVFIAQGCDLNLEGFNIISDQTNIASLWKALVEQQGCIQAGEQAWNQLRVLQGRPQLNSELNSNYNPLEAGLYKAVSLNKGCYIGQETISKVSNRNAIKQQLWGIQLDKEVDVGSKVYSSQENKSLGQVTSIQEYPKNLHMDQTQNMEPQLNTEQTQKQFIAMAYLRCRNQGEVVDMQGLSVKINDTVGQVVKLPYLTRQFESYQVKDEQQEPVEQAIEKKPEQQGVFLSEKEVSEKEKRMQQLQDQLKAWQESQGQDS